MTIKRTAKAVTNFIETKRGTFEGMQEASFRRSEKIINDLLREEKKSFNYPIPPFVPLLLIWLFILLFPLATYLDPSNITSPKINARGVVGFYVPLITTTLIFFIPAAFSKNTTSRSLYTTPCSSSEPCLSAKSRSSSWNGVPTKA